MTLTRRGFLRVTATGALTIGMAGAAGRADAAGTGAPAAAGTIATPAGAVPRLPRRAPLLDATTIRQFALELPVPAVMPPRAGTQDTYDVSIRRIEQRMLPAPFPTTPLFAYGPAADRTGARHTVPGPTIRATAGRPTTVRWINELVDPAGKPLAHLLAVDPTLHWANPERLPAADGSTSTDSMPAFAGRTYVERESFRDPATQFTDYTGPVPVVTHVHGMAGVADDSDGYPEAWFLPAAADAKTYAPHGRWYDFLGGKAARDGRPWKPGEQTCRYPNHNRASLLWYHDHAMGLTRLNVAAGLFGGYSITGGPSGDEAVRVHPGKRAAVLPQPVPLIIQDRAFRTDGSVFFPDGRAFFDEYEGPVVPQAPVAPIWNPEFLGNTITVNGVVWPRVGVTRNRYRIQLLNGCDTRVLDLDFRAIPGLQAWLIGTDGGFLREPVELTGAHGGGRPGAGRAGGKGTGKARGKGGAGGEAPSGRLVLGPAMRADVIVDFAQVAPGRHILTNVANDGPYDPEAEPADPATTGRVLAVDVENRRTPEHSSDPRTLILPALPAAPAPTTTRRVALMEHSHSPRAGESLPTRALLGMIHGDPSAGWAQAMGRGWSDPVTENPAAGATELWEIYNLTEDTHPVHLHQLDFEVVNRQPVEHQEETGVRVIAGAAPTPPAPAENGLLDTVLAPPHQVTRIRATFTTPGQYVWHCHVLSHEDNEMMRPLRVGPVQPGQPAEKAAMHGPM